MKQLVGRTQQAGHHDRDDCDDCDYDHDDCDHDLDDCDHDHDYCDHDHYENVYNYDEQ